ncbi:MAG: metallophosphoesterase family protein [Thermoproteota archaeon]|nr:metallophosphoesterase family protein [Thermoproteota archaeon]
MKIRPIHPHAAILLEGAGRKYITVSDLHIGLEAELLAKGITVSSTLVSEMIDELSDLVQSEHADSIILLGDIKHSVGAISKQEWDTVPVFLKQLSTKADVYLVPGNHDGNIRHLVPTNVNVMASKGMMLDDTLLVHGHSMPSDVRGHVKRIVMGHIHPVFIKKGSVINGERVWIYFQARKEDIFAEKGLLDILVVPTFNRYLYATGAKSYHKSISPILTKAMQHGVMRCIVVTLDGSIVGDAAVLEHIL